MNNIIAIDGPSASGKGTLARKVAQHLSFAHLDTGALYRAVGYHVLKAGANPDNENHAIQAAKDISASIADGESDILANEALKSDESGQAASKVAAIPAVRAALKTLQEEFIKTPPNGQGGIALGAVLDGRDIGTVIAPDAPAKLFITASTEIRAERRFKELQSRGLSVTYDTVLADLRSRDARDEERKASPSKPATDAFIIDTSDLTPDQALEKALEYIKSRITL